MERIIDKSASSLSNTKERGTESTHTHTQRGWEEKLHNTTINDGIWIFFTATHGNDVQFKSERMTKAERGHTRAHTNERIFAK